MMEKYLTDTITNTTAYQRLIDAVLIKQEE